DLEVPDAIAIQGQRSQLVALETEIPVLNQGVLTAQTLLEAEERLFEQLERLTKFQRQFAEITQRQPEITALSERLARSQVADRLQGDWALVQEARTQDKLAANQAQKAALNLTQAETQLQAEGQKLAEVRAEAAALAPQIAAREEALAQAKAYEEQRQQLEQEVAIAATQWQQKQQQQQAAKQELTQAEAQVKAATVQLSLTTDARERHQPGGDRLERLTIVAPLLLEWTLAEKQRKQQAQALDQVSRDRANGDRTYQSTVSELQAAQTAIAQLTQEIAAGERANAEATKSNHAAALRLSLEAGETCPVCGGIHPDSEAELPPLPAIAWVDLTALQTQATTATQALQTAQLNATKAEAALENLTQKQREIQEQLAALTQQQQGLKQQIVEVLQQSEGEELDAIALQQEREALQKRDQAYKEAAAAYQQALTRLETAQQAREFCDRTYQTALTDAQAATEELTRRQQNLQEVREKLAAMTEGLSYQALAQTLAEQKQTLNSRISAAETAHQTAENRVIQARETAYQTQVAAEVAQGKQQQYHTRWQTQLQAANLTESTFLTALASPEEQAKWQQAITHHRESSIELSTRIADLQTEIGDRTTDARQLQQRQQAKQTAEQQLKTAQDKRVELSTWIQSAEQRQAQSEKLLDEQETVSKNYDIYHVLAQNLKTNEFQSYILEHLESELVARATLLLKELTESRYALQMQEGEYWVEDNWNGGELRRVRTLSGGETFATSLTMAIALSEKLSMGAELGSLFLDEGFGTLDSETLESVTQILESLRQQNRTIGVITHVKSLGERLPTQVKVFKSPQGSRLEVERL
ncbi:MAG TPA: SMC family ATPase, partial [Vampirovibrionales bacterium]